MGKRPRKYKRNPKMSSSKRCDHKKIYKYEEGVFVCADCGRVEKVENGGSLAAYKKDGSSLKQA